MNVAEFVSKWKHVELSERSACHEHFLSLGALSDQPTPAVAGNARQMFAFEKGADEQGADMGWADVWQVLPHAWKHAVPPTASEAGPSDVPYLSSQAQLNRWRRA